MTDSGFSPAPAVTTRPGIVTLSSYLLYAAAALTLISAVTALSFVGATSEVIRDAYQGTAAEGAEGVVVAFSVAGAVINVLFAIALVVLGIFNGRGRNPSRIVTWVLGGLGVCCGGVGALGTAVSSSMTSGAASGPGVPDAAETERRLAEALPGWYTPVTTTLSVLTVLCILTAVILLALPAANAFFRKPPATWSPGQPGFPPSPYPAAAPYPTAGYPTAPYPTAPYPAAPQPPDGTPPYQGQGPPGQVPPGQVPPGQVPPGAGQGPDDWQPPRA